MSIQLVSANDYGRIISMATLELSMLPARLYLEGAPALLGATRRVAIVGSRSASPDGLRRATRLARELVKADVVVVSGLATGIDTAAHRSAIGNDGRTIAVIATPITKVYPRANVRLQARIGAEHLLVSQFDPETKIAPGNFVARNRTMAVLSHASVIVECQDRSGTLTHASESLRIGHPVFILRSAAENTSIKWPAELIGRGAIVLNHVDQIMRVLK
jgi:DNA processing protein